MPKTKFQEVIFTIIMVFFMVYAMICYNTALNIGEMKTKFFFPPSKNFLLWGRLHLFLTFSLSVTLPKSLLLRL